MAAAEIIVVAPDVAFRHSLIFVLESGDFTVLSYGSIEAAFASPRVCDAGCAVVDEEAIDSWQSAHELFEGFARPVIMLVSFPRATPGARAVRYLAKPFLGKPLLDAVQEAIAGNSGPAA